MTTEYELLGPDGYEERYRYHIAAAKTDVNDWQKVLRSFGLPTTGRLLDIGCGLGECTALWAHQGYQVTGLDRDQRMLEAARASFPSVRFVCGNALEPMQESYDLVVARFNFLMVLSDEEAIAFLRNMRKCVTPGGVVMTDVCYPSKPPTPFAAEWIRNGRAIREVGAPTSTGYRHCWFEGENHLCTTEFRFRTQDEYRLLGETAGWHVSVQDWRTNKDIASKYLIFSAALLQRKKAQLGQKGGCMPMFGSLGVKRQQSFVQRLISLLRGR